MYTYLTGKLNFQTQLGVAATFQSNSPSILLNIQVQQGRRSIQWQNQPQTEHLNTKNS